MNLLYCFDTNYDKQTYISIMSFLEKNDCNLDIYIIHNDPSTFQKYINKLNKFPNINISIIKFKNEENVHLPIKRDDHVSEATYYRLFIEKYLPKDVNHVLYVDSDVMCVRNIELPANRIFNELLNSDKIIASKLDGIQEGNEELFRNLNMDGSYFNAGVMFIDLTKWRLNGLSKKLFSKLRSLEGKITFWDQDVLNSFFNGNYLEVGDHFNFYINDKTKKTDLEKISYEVFLIHYAGSNKPWTVDGGLRKSSNYYQELSLKYLKKYHLVTKYRMGDVKNIYNSILNREIFELAHPFKYLRSCIYSIVKK